MKIEIGGSPKEIAALALAVQERKERITFGLKISDECKNAPIVEHGNEITVDEKELADELENLPDNPYQTALWVDENGEVTLAVFGDSLKFKKREDARHVFGLIERLFDGIEGGKLA